MSASPRLDAPVRAAASSSSRSSQRSRAAAYLALTKPRIIELLLVTTVPVMFAAAGGIPDGWTVVATVVGGSLAAGGANAFNCVLDADIDAHMARTAARPTVTGEISSRAALLFAGCLSAASVLLLWLTTNAGSALLAAGAIAAYVVGYTILLKRRTSQNIVWGGIAGCFPVLIGWCAVTGNLSVSAWTLFALIFVWTPAHYWPLSIKYRDDYAAAGVPMLGSVASAATVARSVIAYTLATVAVAVVYGAVAAAGALYWVVSTVAGAWFLMEAVGLAKSARTYTGADGSTSAGEAVESAVASRSMRVFHVSISYLALVFLAVGLDPFLR